MTAMATWPAQGDYRDALQNLDVAFREQDLRYATVERNRMGVPRARSGAFASVYKLTRANGQSMALKLFNFPNEERQGRYQIVSNHLAKLGAKRPGCLVEFAYQLEGVRVQGKWYPTQTMAWVTGQSLGQWLRDRMLAKAFPLVRTIADDWVQLIGSLQEAKIAHGDLQHDNVMVASNKLLLVDYDGMCVPGLEGQAQHEYGKPAYQHPTRGSQKLSLEIDNFASWIILVGLRACVADPNLYMKYVEKAENENVLFAESDLRAPSKSPLWPELARSPDADVREWSSNLRAMLEDGFDFKEIPRLSLNPFAKLTDLCQPTSPDWDSIVEEANRLQNAGKTLPTSPPLLMQRIAEARQRVTKRDKLRAALMAKDFVTLNAIYEPTLFTNWANQAGLVKQIERVKHQAGHLDRLAKAAIVQDHGQTLIRTWDELAQQLDGIAEADRFRTQVNTWRAKNTALQKLRTVLTSSTERAVADAWAQLAKLGQHPDLKPFEIQRAQQAPLRAERLDRLKAVPNVLSETADRALIAAWDDSLITSNEAKQYQLRVDAARPRLAMLKTLAQVVLEFDQGRAESEAVFKASAALPVAYEHSLKQRLQDLRESQKYLAALYGTLNRHPQLDSAIATAWEAIRTKHPTQAAQLDAAKKARCELAAKRSAAIQAIAKHIKNSKDDHSTDVQIYKIWKPIRDDLAQVPEFQPYAPRAAKARERLKAWNAMKTAIDSREFSKIVRYAQLPELQGYPPLVAATPMIAEYIGISNWMTELSAKLKNANQATGLPLTSEDLKKMQVNAHLFDDKFRAAVAKLVAMRISDAAGLEESDPAFQMQTGRIPSAKVFWRWNGNSLVSRFLIATNPEAPLKNPQQATAERTSTCRPEDHSRDGGGRSILLNDRGEVWVSIWPVVELGWETVYGTPLNIGPIVTGGRA